ncbi:ABC transporter ATP-binding protein [Nonomuraea sp. NPDC050556]|uniref:ABC transporter ATP-binding protein n=1 Tax=Nonomuraea sp. NPDC050556 TaxID=3364369 RepID=UPI00379AB611
MKPLALMLHTTFAADRPRAVGAFAIGAFESVCRVAFAFWVSMFIGGAARGDLDACLWAGASYGASLALVGVSNMLRVKWAIALQEKIAFRLDREMMRVSAGLPEIEHHERPEFLDRMSLIRQDRAELGQGVWALIGLAQSIVALLFAAALMATVSPWLILLLVFAVPAVLANRKIASVTADGGVRSSADLRRAQHLSEVGASPAAGKELRVFGLQGEILRRYASAWTSYDHVRSRAERTAALLSIGGLAVFGLGYCAALMLVVTVSAGESTATRIGLIALAFTVASQINHLVTSAAFNLTALGRSLTGYSRLRWLLHYGREAAAEQAAVPAPDRISHGIVFTDVGFRYPGSTRDVLSGVNLTIPAGTTVAIVGDNGAGKSTLVKLLARFYRPTVGTITIDGTDLSAIDVRQWRERLSAGFQDFAQFEFTAAESVGVGDLPRVGDRAAVHAALERARSTDVLDRLPNGLDTQLGQTAGDGVQLSGGQWQKLALARAVMREQPLLLLLDEPTASLDAEAEHRLFEAQAVAARTAGRLSGAITVLVSHRYSTTRDADLIVVVQQGRVTQCGTHEQLVAAGGLYADLFSLQAQAYR